MPVVGDVVTVSLVVDAGDGTTAVALVVDEPDGTRMIPAVTTADSGRTWTAPVTYTVPGVWRLTWTISGAGAGVMRELVSVGPVPGAAPDGRTYATTTQLAEYLQDAPPVDAAKRLAEASRMLDARVLRYCRYEVDALGMPDDPDVAEAISRATCAQVAWWDEVGDSRGAAGVGYSNVAIGSVNLGRSTSVTGENSAARQIAPQVRDELLAPHLHDKLVVGGLEAGW